MLASGGCADEDRDHGFTIQGATIRVLRGRLAVHLDDSLQFSPEAVQALEHGVPLTISVDMELRNQETLNLLAEQERSFEIRYLPLSQHYQLTTVGTGQVRTYPRLRHAVSALTGLDLMLATGPLAPGDYIFRGRIRLDRASLPGPMQLPVMLSTRWRHDSEWHQWPFRISA